MTLATSDMKLLERDYAMYVLLAIDAQPGRTMSEIMRLEDAHERTKYVRMAELLDAGLICRKRSEWTKFGLFLTPEGERIVKHIKPIRRELMRLEKKRKAIIVVQAEYVESVQALQKD